MKLSLHSSAESAWLVTHTRNRSDLDDQVEAINIMNVVIIMSAANNTEVLLVIF